MKKILIFSLAYYPSHISGAEIAIKEITDRIDPGKYEFHLLTVYFDRKLPREEKIGNVHVYRVGFGSAYVSKVFFVPLAALKAKSLDRRHHFAAAWVMMTYMLFPLVLSKMIGLRLPYILTLQDGDPYEKVFERWFVRPLTPLLDWGMHKAKVIQAISAYLAEWPKKRVQREDAVIIPNGASMPSAQEYPKEELDELRKSINVKEGERIMLTVARLVHQKAQDQVIRALPLLPKHVRYVMAGEGEDREMLQKLAKELNVSDRVYFAGHVDRSMTAKFRKIADVFVYPSRSEGQGISLLSTMVSGLPFVATQVGGIAEFLFDAKRNPEKMTTGFAVDVDSPEQIARQVMYVLDHYAEAKKIAENAKIMARETYSWDAITRAMQEKVFDRAAE